jgi:hypothetical protein
MGDTIVQLIYSPQVWLNRNDWGCAVNLLRKLFCQGERTMSEFVTKAVAQQQRQKTETRTAVGRIAGFTIVATAVAMLAVLVVTAVYAQDKYSLESPSGIAFSDFRGYEDWAVVSSARQDEILKVIVANPRMINAYKAGAPGNGQTFPDGSMIVKLQWKRKKSTEAPFVVDVPDVFKQTFRHGKGQQEISEDRRMGICGVQLRCCVGQVRGRSPKSVRLRKRVPHSREGEGLHLPPVPEALNRGPNIK